jgi:hypothetical protein
MFLKKNKLRNPENKSKLNDLIDILEHQRDALEQ